MGDETWVTETVNDADGFRTSLKAAGPPRRLQSTQDLQVFDSIAFGKVMLLDGAFQITAADEFIYHEMMAHAPLFAHGAVRDVLIIGGGDGGVDLAAFFAVEGLLLMSGDTMQGPLPEGLPNAQRLDSVPPAVALTWPPTPPMGWCIMTRLLGRQ